jgi:hypothetical protein
LVAHDKIWKGEENEKEFIGYVRDPFIPCIDSAFCENKI